MICPPDHKHAATMTCYSKHGCRCDDCRTHNANARRAEKARRRGTLLSAQCERCGITQMVSPAAAAKFVLCRDCKDVEPNHYHGVAA